MLCRLTHGTCTDETLVGVTNVVCILHTVRVVVYFLRYCYCCLVGLFICQNYRNAEWTLGVIVRNVRGVLVQYSGEVPYNQSSKSRKSRSVAGIFTSTGPFGSVPRWCGRCVYFFCCIIRSFSGMSWETRNRKKHSLRPGPKYSEDCARPWLMCHIGMWAMGCRWQTSPRLVPLMVSQCVRRGRGTIVVRWRNWQEGTGSIEVEYPGAVVHLSVKRMRNLGAVYSCLIRLFSQR